MKSMSSWHRLPKPLARASRWEARDAATLAALRDKVDVVYEFNGHDYHVTLEEAIQDASPTELAQRFGALKLQEEAAQRALERILAQTAKERARLEQINLLARTIEQGSP